MAGQQLALPKVAELLTRMLDVLTSSEIDAEELNPPQ
jgi:hypothetical protein